MGNNSPDYTHIPVICIANHKGGVGKTTTTAALAYLFANEEKWNVLLIDADAQTNLTQTMRTSCDGRIDIQSAVISRIKNIDINIDVFILPTQYERIDMIPGNLMIENENFLSQVRRAKLEEDINPWQEVIEDAKQLGKYDIILLDSHPSVGMDTLLPMQACDKILVPMEADERSVAGLSQVYQNIIKSRRRANPHIKLLGYFFNKVKGNTNSTKDYIPSARADIPQMIAKLNNNHPEGICFDATIRDSEDVRKSINFHCAVTAKFKNKKIAQDFKNLHDEIIEVLQFERRKTDCQ